MNPDTSESVDDGHDVSFLPILSECRSCLQCLPGCCLALENTLAVDPPVTLDEEDTHNIKGHYISTHGQTSVSLGWSFKPLVQNKLTICTDNGMEPGPNWILSGYYLQ